MLGGVHGEEATEKKLGLQAGRPGRLFGICPPRGHGCEGKYATGTDKGGSGPSPAGTGFDISRGLADGPWRHNKFALSCECASLRLQIDAEWYGVLPRGGAKAVLSLTHPGRYVFYAELGYCTKHNRVAVWTRSTQPALVQRIAE